MIRDYWNLDIKLRADYPVGGLFVSADILHCIEATCLDRYS